MFFLARICLMVFFGFGLWSGFSYVCAYASDPVLFSMVRHQFNICRHADVLEDPKGTLTLADLMTENVSRRFESCPGNKISLNNSPSTFWIRFRLSDDRFGGYGGEEDGWRSWVLELRNISSAQVALFVPDGHLKSASTAENYLVFFSSQHHENALNNVHFRLPRRVSDGAYYFLRTTISGPMQIGLTLWQPQDFENHALFRFLVSGMIYGAIMAIILYNLVMFMIRRVRVYLYFIFLMAGVLLYFAILFGHMQAVAIDTVSIPFLNRFFFAVSLCAYAMFTSSFLKTPSKAVQTEKFIRVLMASSMMPILVGVAGYERVADFIIAFLFLSGGAIGLVAGVLCIKKDFDPARNFIFSLCLVIAGVLTAKAGAVMSPGTLFSEFTLGATAVAGGIAFTLSLYWRDRWLIPEHLYFKRPRRRTFQSAIIDERTGLFNDRYFESRLLSDVNHSHSVDQPLSLLILDVDDFVRYNEKYGVHAGDNVLSQIAETIRNCIRDRDTACRLGSDEFSVILPETQASFAITVAERIRQEVEKQVRSPRPGRYERISISIGLAQLFSQDSVDDLLRRADRALSLAKAQGKNQVVVAV